MKTLSLIPKRLPAIGSLLLFVGSLLLTSFLPFLMGRAEAATPSSINLIHRQEVGVAVNKAPDFTTQTCTGTFTTTSKTPALLQSEIFVNAQQYNTVVQANTPNDLAALPNITNTRVGSLNRDDLWKLVHDNLNGNINVIRFSPATNGGVTPVNGSFVSGGNLCQETTMVQINSLEYRGWQMRNQGPGFDSWGWHTFTASSPSPDGTTGRLLFFDFDQDCPSGPGQQNGGPAANADDQCTTNNFVMAGTPVVISGGGGGTINAATGNWLDAGHLTLTDAAHQGEVYEKQLWYADTVTDSNGNADTNWSLYFLKSATTDRSALTTSSGKPFCANPIATGTAQPSACNNCVPFIAIHQGINLSHKSGTSGPFDIAGFDNRLHRLGGAAATIYDYNGDCTYKGSAQTTLGNQNNALVWFYYSTTEDKMVTVFTSGSGNEARFTGLYNKFGTDAYQGGTNGCSGKTFVTVFPTAQNTANWEMSQGNCATGEPADGTAHILVQGGSVGEVNFASTVGALPVNTGTTHGDAEHPSCENQSVNPLSWFLCPIVTGLAAFSDFILENFIIPFIQPSAVGLNPGDPQTGSVYKIWSAFRVYGDIVLVVALIVAVLSQAFGGGIVEAYTARKMLPRVLIAAILVNISIYIVAFAVDLSRIIGNGISDLITAPLNITGTFTFTIGTGTGTIISGALAAILLGLTAITVTGGVGLITAILPFIGLFVILPAFLALLGAFATLMFLQALVLALIISSPVAFALYCLPNTEKYFKTWWDWFFRALLIFPIFMTIVGIANLMTALIQQANSKGPTSILATIMAFFVQFLPLLLVPFSFKLAGGFVGKVYALLGGYGSKITEAVKGNPNDQRSMRNRYRYRAGSAVDQARGDMYAMARNASKGTGGGIMARTGRRVARVASKGLNFGDLEGRSAERIAEQEKYIAAQYSTGPDNSIRALWAVQENGRWFSPYQTYNPTTGRNERKEWAASDVAKARQRARRDPAIMQAMAKYEFQKAADDGQIDKFKERFATEATRVGWSQEQASSAWTGVVFSHQGTRKEQKFTSIKQRNDGSFYFDDKRTSDVTGNRLEYGDVNQANFSTEMTDAVRKYDYAGFRPSTGKAALEGYQENSAIASQLGAAARTRPLTRAETERLQGAQQIVNNWQSVADNLRPMFESGGRIPPGAFGEEGGGGAGAGAGYPTYGAGGSAEAEKVWKTFVSSIPPRGAAPPPAAP